jgi:hypothetical protein
VANEHTGKRARENARFEVPLGEEAR